MDARAGEERDEEVPGGFWPRWLVTGNTFRDLFVGAGVVAILPGILIVAFFVYARVCG